MGIVDQKRNQIRKSDVYLTKVSGQKKGYESDEGDEEEGKMDFM